MPEPTVQSGWKKVATVSVVDPAALCASAGHVRVSVSYRFSHISRTLDSSGVLFCCAWRATGSGGVGQGGLVRMFTGIVEEMGAVRAIGPSPTREWD